MAYDVKNYDRFKNAATADTYERLREVTEEQQRRAVNPYVGALADKLRSIFSASPDAFGHIPADEAAALLLAHWPRSRYERI